MTARSAQASRSSGAQTLSGRVVEIVQALGGRAERAEVARPLAPILGVRDARSALGLALIGGQVRLDDDDVLHLAEGDA
jgi:hypothetical protein